MKVAVASSEAMSIVDCVVVGGYGDALVRDPGDGFRDVVVLLRALVYALVECSTWRLEDEGEEEVCILVYLDG